jgi:hypothetical protein
MKIAFASALLVGLAAARTKLMSITDSIDLVSSTPLTITGTYDADLGYSTAYTIAEVTATPYIWSNSYSLEVDAYATADLEINLFDYFTYDISVCMTLFDFTPITQYLTFTRPDAFIYEGFGVYQLELYAERDLTFGTIQVTHTPDVAVTSVSLYDAISNIIGGSSFTLSDWLPSTAAQWALQADEDVYFDDSYLTYSLDTDLLGLDTTTWWYGSQQWYYFTLSA